MEDPHNLKGTFLLNNKHYCFSVETTAGLYDFQQFGRNSIEDNILSFAISRRINDLIVSEKLDQLKDATQIEVCDVEVYYKIDYRERLKITLK